MVPTVRELQLRLQEAEDLLRAMRSGEVDAVVVSGADGEKVYTLNGAEHSYRVMVETMNEGAVVVAGDGTIFYANRSFATMLDTPLEEVIGSKLDRFVPPEHRPRYEALIQRHDGGPGRGEIQLAAKTGAVVPVLLSASSFESGTSTGASVVVTDLTEHKRHEELRSTEAVERTKRHEAEAAQRRIAGILESITDSFFLLDHDWRITDLNQCAAANFGTTREKLLGTLFWEMSPEHRVPELDEQYRRAMAQRVAVHTDAPSAGVHGRWFERHIYPAGDGLAIYFRDITERKLIEERTAYQAKLLANVHDAIVATDDQFVLTAWNSAAEEIYGWKAEDVIGRSVGDVVRSDFTASQRSAALKTLNQTGHLHVEVAQYTRGGRRIWMQAHTTVLRDDSGSITGYVAASRDVTERKEGDEERVRLLRRIVDAQEDERRRIALEMHDQFGQQLSALALTLSTLKGQSSGRRNLNEQIEALEGIIRQLDTDLEVIVSRLRPPALDDLGLVAALTNYVTGWSKHFDIEADLHVTGVAQGRLTNEIDTALYRITQEALNNVVKHGQARKVAVLLAGRPDAVSLIVEDDGVGFDVEAVGPRQSFGVAGMRERAKLLGGTLDIESHAGKGTSVVARIPRPEDPEPRSV